MGPSLPRELSSGPSWRIGEPEEDGVRRASHGRGACPGQPRAQACSLRSRETFNKQAAHRRKLPSPPNQTGESYPTMVSLLGPGRLPLSKEKLFSSSETWLCVSELRVVKRKLLWSHLPKFTFQTWLGAEGLMLELTAQPPVSLWAEPATSRVSWSLGRLIRAEGPPGSKHFRGCRGLLGSSLWPSPGCRSSSATLCPCSRSEGGGHAGPMLGT